MKKFLLSLVVLCAHSISAQNANWSWAVKETGAGADYPRHVTTDASGNVYTTGGFGSLTYSLGNSVVVNSGPFNTADFYLAKYTPAGVPLWVVTGLGAANEEGFAITTDAAQNVYVAGYFQSSSLVLGTYTLANTSNIGEADIFIAKYDETGNLLWATSYGGPNFEYPYAIAADASGNLFVTGTFGGATATFGSYTLNNLGQNDSYVLRLDTAGTIQWIEHVGFNQDDILTAGSLNGLGHFVVAGSYQSSSLTFTPAPVNAGGYDLIIATYDAAGNVIMSKSFGGINNEMLSGMTTDALGNIYITGYFESSQLVLGTHTLTNVSGRDLFVAKLSNTGNVVWAYRNEGNPNTYTRALDVDASGNLYLAGIHNMILSFGSTTLNSGSSQIDAYLVKMSAATGSVVWAKSMSGSDTDNPFAVSADLYGSVYVVGSFAQNITIGSHTLTANASGFPDVFLAKLCNNPPPVTVPGVTVCAGTSAAVTLTLPAMYVAAWYNAAVNGTLLSSSPLYSTVISQTVFLTLADTIPGCGFSSVPVSVNFSVHPTASISVLGNSLIANVTTSLGFTYDWFDCVYGGLVSEYSNEPFVPYANGSYALIIKIDNCVDTSDCFSYVYNSIAEHDKPESRVYAVASVIHIEAQESNYIVSDLLGRVQRSGQIINGRAAIANLVPGVYVVTGDALLPRKVFVE